MGQVSDEFGERPTNLSQVGCRPSDSPCSAYIGIPNLFAVGFDVCKQRSGKTTTLVS